MADVTISELARTSGFSSSALRYYERVGLLTPTTRSPAGYRKYDEEAVERLAFIARAKRLGLQLEEIRELVGLWENGPCAPVQDRLRALVDEKVALLDTQARENVRFHAQLAHVQRSLATAEPTDRCGPGCGCAMDLPADSTVPIACTLDAEAMPARLDEWQGTLDRVEEREAVPGGVRLRFAPEPALVAAVASLAAREVECSAFFTFALSLAPDAAWLTITAPADAQSIVAALFGAAPA